MAVNVDVFTVVGIEVNFASISECLVASRTCFTVNSPHMRIEVGSSIKVFSTNMARYIGHPHMISNNMMRKLQTAILAP